MKKLLAFVLIVFILFAGAFCLDSFRMSKGKSVIFSTWGRNYIPSVSNDVVKSDSAVHGSESDAGENEESISVKLYFPDANVMNLKAEERSFANDSNLAKNVLLAVIKGPESAELLPSLAGDFVVLDVSADKTSGTCTVNLSAEFAKYNTGSTTVETMALYSVVNSLCSIDGISDVKIDIEGNKKASFGHFDISEPIQPDMAMVK